MGAVAQRLPFGAFAEQQRVVAAFGQRITGGQLAHLFAAVGEAHQRVAPHQIDGALRRTELDRGDVGKRQPVVNAVQRQLAHRPEAAVTVGQPVETQLPFLVAFGQR